MSAGEAPDRGRAECDVLVVGGGPAGSTLAGLLALRGRKVTLLDRSHFPRPKACGECVNPGAVRTLRRLGLLDDVLALDPKPLRGFDVVSDGGRRARGRYGDDGEGVAVARSRLDRALLETARRRGARVEEGVRVTGVTEAEERGGSPRRGEGGWTMPHARTREADGSAGVRHARVVVGADGLRSTVARALAGPPPEPSTRKVSLTARLAGEGPPDDRGRLVIGAEGTVGLAPVGEGLWNVTVVVDPERWGRRIAGDPAAFLMGFQEGRIGDWATPPRLVDGPWASGRFDRPVRRTVGEGVLLVGDAAGYYDPLTGQGIFRALRSAEMAAAVIDSALGEDRVSGRAVAGYARRLRRSFAPGRRLQRTIEAAISREWSREAVIDRLAGAPASTDALIRVTGDARPVRSLLEPRVWWPLLTGATGEG